MNDQHHIQRNPLAWLGLAGMSAVAITRCLAVLAPQVAFDLEPVLDAAAFNGIGPAGSMLLDALLLGFAAIALTGEVRAGRGIDWMLVVLALIPAIVIGWRGWFELGDLWRGSTWLSGMVAGVAAAHVARDPKMRILMIALLIGVAGPLMVRGGLQMTSEHAATVKQYQQIRPQFLLARGWEPDSPQARIFERRLNQPQPTGWFLTTNIFASFMAGSLVCWLAWTITAVRRRLKVPWVVLGALLTLASLAGLVACRSKGAIVVAAVGVGVLLLTRWKIGRFPLARRLMPLALMMLAGLALLAIVVRGAVLSESFMSEKSLLFRWHYLQGGAAVIAEHPLAGAGPDGFQQAYLAVRPVRAPEEVVSSHNAFMDWLAMLGASGAAWIALTAVFTWRIGAAAGARIEADEPIPVLEEDRKRDVAIIGLVALAAVGGALAIERAGLPMSSAISRVVGCGLFVVIAAAAWRLMREQRESERRIMMLAIAAVLLVHAQIEMTFFESGSAAWCMMLLGALSGARDGRRASKAALIWPTFIVIVAGAIAWGGVRPAWKQARLMREAAALLEEPSSVGPDRGSAATWASAKLEQAWEAGGQRDRQPMEEAARLRLKLASIVEGERQLERLRQARIFADSAHQQHGRLSSLSMLAGIDATIWRATREQAALDQALEELRELTRRDPRSPEVWRRLGDLLWDAERREEAAAAYRTALARDGDFALDEMKQMSQRVRQMIQGRIHQGTER